jgi:hypothetical protein
MPRRKPDLTPFYPEDKDRIDGISARTPYFSTYSTNVTWGIRDTPSTQRMVKCKECGTVIPRNIPRVWLEAAYRYNAGHYCMTCARERLAEIRSEYATHIDRAQEYVKTIEKLEAVTYNVTQDQRYIDALAMGRMISVIRGKKRE